VAQALLFGGVASASLVLGAVLGALWKPPEHLTAAMLAFSGGALTSALSFELFAEADQLGGVWYAGAGMLVGAGAFIIIDAHILSGMRGSAAGIGLLAAATLDGISENLALGVSLIEGASVALLAAISVANLPEALGSAVRMRESGRSIRFVVGTWSVVAVLLAASVVGGRLLLGGASGGMLAVLLGFAGGAVLAALAVTVFPEAYKHGGPFVAFATVAGFLAAYVLSHT